MKYEFPSVEVLDIMFARSTSQNLPEMLLHPGRAGREHVVLPSTEPRVAPVQADSPTNPAKSETGKKSGSVGSGVPRTPTRIQRELLIAALVDSLDDAGMELLATRVFERPYDVFNPRWVRSEIALKIVERAESQRRLDDLQREATKLNPDNELLHTWFMIATQRLSTPYRGLSPF